MYKCIMVQSKPANTKQRLNLLFQFVYLYI